MQVMEDALEQHPEAGLALSANVIDPEVPYPELLEPRKFFRRCVWGRSPIGVGPTAAINRCLCFKKTRIFALRQTPSILEGPHKNPRRTFFTAAV